MYTYELNIFLSWKWSALYQSKGRTNAHVPPHGAAGTVTPIFGALVLFLPVRPPLSSTILKANFRSNAILLQRQKLVFYIKSWAFTTFYFGKFPTYEVERIVERILYLLPVISVLLFQPHAPPPVFSCWSILKQIPDVISFYI